MAAEGQTIALNTQGPNGGVAFMIVDYERKIVSFVEIFPRDPDQIAVLNVQDYTVPGD
jgi:hypothetical protein